MLGRVQKGLNDGVHEDPMLVRNIGDMCEVPFGLASSQLDRIEHRELCIPCPADLLAEYLRSGT